MKVNTLTQAAKAVRGNMAYGAVVQVEPDIFLATLAKIETPLVVMSHNKNYFSELFQYLTSYKGLFFYAESKQPLELPEVTELVEVERMRAPSY